MPRIFPPMNHLPLKKVPFGHLVAITQHGTTHLGIVCYSAQDEDKTPRLAVLKKTDAASTNFVCELASQSNPWVMDLGSNFTLEATLHEDLQADATATSIKLGRATLAVHGRETYLVIEIGGTSEFRLLDLRTWSISTAGDDYMALIHKFAVGLPRADGTINWVMEQR